TRSVRPSEARQCVSIGKTTHPTCLIQNATERLSGPHRRNGEIWLNFGSGRGPSPTSVRGQPWATAIVPRSRTSGGSCCSSLSAFCCGHSFSRLPRIDPRLIIQQLYQP